LDAEADGDWLPDGEALADGEREALGETDGDTEEDRSVVVAEVISSQEADVLVPTLTNILFPSLFSL